MESKGSMDTSVEALNFARESGNESMVSMNFHKMYQREKKRVRNEGQSVVYNSDYKPAVYSKALFFKDSLSYKKKIDETTYKQIQLFEDTDSLKVFGLGPYFFIQFQRRLVWLFFVFAIIQAVRVYINIRGTGLSEYSGSFGSFLISTTIGNFDQNVIFSGDVYFLSLIPFFLYFGLFIFYLMWSKHYEDAIKIQQDEKQFIKPEKFCVQVQGFDMIDNVQEQDLETIFSGFGPIYQISLAREYAGNLKYFQEMDQLQQKIKQEQLQLLLGSGDKNKLQKDQKRKQELTKKIQTIMIKPSVRSAYIHFQFQKSKVDMLDYFNSHYLFSQKLSHSFVRAICGCCVEDCALKLQYKGKNLKIKSQKVPQPQDINWDYYQVSTGSRIIRIILATLIIIVFLAASCTIIGLCSIYVTSHSLNCEGVTLPTSVKLAISQITSTSVKKCYCNANFVSSFSSEDIKQYCGDMLTQVYTEQAIQYAITGTATVVNIIFGFIVTKIVNLTQPLSFSTGYLWRTAIFTIFLIINTVVLPLLIYADIFGFKPSNYVSFVTIISSDLRAFFSVQTISFNVDFSRIWYRNVSPIFANYIILDTLLTWVFFVIYKLMCNKQNLEKKEGCILQKTMNLQIISWKLNVSQEYSIINLIVFMSIFYSAGMPILIPLAFLDLLSKYISNRSLLQSVSSRVEGLSQAFNSLALTLMPITIILACVVGSWMLTGNSIIYSTRTMQLYINNLQYTSSVVWRQLLLPFYLILGIVILIYFLFSNTFVRLCGWVSRCCHNRKQVVHPYYTKQYSQYAKTMSINASYNIRHNLKFKNVIYNLQNYLHHQELKNI